MILSLWNWWILIPYREMLQGKFGSVTGWIGCEGFFVAESKGTGFNNLLCR